MANYPKSIVPVGHTEPVPRRIRAIRDGRVVIDTTQALYVWEVPYYPQYLIPVADVTGVDLPPEAKPGFVCFHWNAFDAWYEEDEQVFVHPRNPYARVDAIRSTRTVRVELDGLRLAESHSPVMVFETGLPPRYYLNRTEVDFTHLEPSTTRTACPYKGTTGGYWSVHVNGVRHPDLAWSYDFPTLALTPIAGLIAFYNEKVDIFLDGQRLPR